MNAEKRLRVGFQVQMTTMYSEEKNLFIVYIAILLRLDKSVMAPNLFSKTNKISRNTNIEKKIKKQLLELRRYIEKNCKYVGYNFTSRS